MKSPPKKKQQLFFESFVRNMNVKYKSSKKLWRHIEALSCYRLLMLLMLLIMLL